WRRAPGTIPRSRPAAAFRRAHHARLWRRPALPRRLPSPPTAQRVWPLPQAPPGPAPPETHPTPGPATSFAFSPSSRSFQSTLVRSSLVDSLQTSVLRLQPFRLPVRPLGGGLRTRTGQRSRIGWRAGGEQIVDRRKGIDDLRTVLEESTGIGSG